MLNRRIDGVQLAALQLFNRDAVVSCLGKRFVFSVRASVGLELDDADLARLQFRSVRVGFGFNIRYTVLRPVPDVQASASANSLGIPAEPAEAEDGQVKPSAKEP